MVKASPFFWTDVEQAQQRLMDSYVLYDDTPAHIREVVAHTDGIPRASIFLVGALDYTTKRLDSPKFEKFRRLPSLGWVNHRTNKGLLMGVFLERVSRNTRTHGLSDASVRTKALVKDSYIPQGGVVDFRRVASGEGFVQCHKGLYPSLAATLENIEEGQAIAYSRNFLVYRDTLGVRWLYRKCERVGIFTGTDTLNIFSKFAFYREEIMEDPAFTLNNIREF